MNSKKLKPVFGIHLPALSALALAWNAAFAAEYWLRADTVGATMPDGATVPMWGFALDNATFTSGNPATVPGPMLTVPPGDGTLTIHLKNNGLPEPVSIVIPGQIASMTPVKTDDAKDRPRVRSFTSQTPAGGTGTYTWTHLRPGTYLYHSGTHPQVQVQMGLYGGMTKNAAAGQAYPGVGYDREVVLLYSEIDPALHAAVANGSYGTAAYPSTIDYKPRYFLVNGEPYDANSPPLPLSAGASGQKTLIRFLNAGLQTHVPVLQGLDMSLVAEDGHPYPYVKTQYSAMLPAAKTLDAILSPASGQDGRYPIYDRRLNLTNGIQPGGGMLAYLTVGAAAPGGPAAVNDAYSTDEDTPLSVAAPGVLANDTGTPPLGASLAAPAAKGTVSLAADGSFSYTPAANVSGIDSFTYRAASGTASSNVATVTITVNPVNDPPVAQNNAYSMSQGGTLTVAAPGVLANDTDPDGNTLAAADFGAASNGTVTGNANGGFTYTPAAAFTGTATFTYRARDNSGAANDTSAPATVSVTVNPNQAPVARDDSATTRTNTAVTINVIANDSDPDGSVAPNSITIVTRPNRGGTATPNANGTVTYRPRLNFRGTDAFTYTVKDNLGKTSNVATVRVNVTR